MNRRQFIKTSATATVLTSQTPALAGMSSPLPDFRFQSNFWINLHHTLYYQTQVLETVYGLGTAHLAPMEERAYEDLKRVRGEYAHDWYEALRIYRVNYASLDFVFSDTMVRIDNALARAIGADLPVHRDLLAPLQQALTLAAPAYRSSLWPHHDAGNRAFVAELQTKANRFGPGLARRLAQLYRTPWLREPYVVDVMPYAQGEGSFGNYAHGFFHIAMSADDPVESGLSGLDILFHEASHSTTDPRYGRLVLPSRRRANA